MDFKSNMSEITRHKNVVRFDIVKHWHVGKHYQIIEIIFGHYRHICCMVSST